MVFLLTRSELAIPPVLTRRSEPLDTLFLRMSDEVFIEVPRPFFERRGDRGFPNRVGSLAEALSLSC